MNGDEVVLFICCWSCGNGELRELMGELRYVEVDEVFEMRRVFWGEWVDFM